MVDKIGGRKVVVALITLALGIGAVFLRGDIPPGLLTLMQTLFGAFVAGNMFEYASEAYTTVKSAAPTAPSQEVEEALTDTLTIVKNQHEALSTQVAQAQQGVAQVQETLVVIANKIWPNQ
jgi:hypothetical protein